MNKLLLLAHDADEYIAPIEAAALQALEIRVASDTTSARTLVGGCNIVLGAPPMVSEILETANRLEWVQSSWAGVDALCSPGSRRDYVLTGLKGVFGPMISEYVMTYLFALERQVFTMRNNQMNRHWQRLTYRPSREITIGIVGLGSIGRHLARTARAFGLRVTGMSRSGKPCGDVERVYTPGEKTGFFSEPDYIVLTLPETAETKQFVDAEVFKLMKPTAVLMNVGRGSVINETDLVTALHDGMIGGAVLDVFADEPLARDHPLWLMPNVYITPHNAAVSFAEDIAGVFVSNYRRYLRGEPLQNVVDFDSGY